jgi:hypothetical protein
MKRGFFRLWVLASAFWITGCAATIAFRVYSKPACYALFSVAFVDPIPEKNRELAKDIEQSLVGKSICDDASPSSLLSLERLAKEGVAKQVSLQWQESGGWSVDIHARIHLLEGKDINVATIQREVRDIVRADGLRANLWLVYFGIGLPILTFLTGLGIFWVFAGFSG